MIELGPLYLTLPVVLWDVFTMILLGIKLVIVRVAWADLNYWQGQDDAEVLTLAWSTWWRGLLRLFVQLLFFSVGILALFLVPRPQPPPQNWAESISSWYISAVLILSQVLLLIQDIIDYRARTTIAATAVVPPVAEPIKQTVGEGR